MPFRVSGKNIDVGEALRERISAASPKRWASISTAAIRATSPSARRASAFAPNARSISIPGSRCTPKARRPTPMPAPIRRRCASRSGCAAIIAGSRSIGSDRHRRPRPRSRRASYMIAAPEQDERSGDRRVQAGDHRGIDHHAEALSVSEAVMELDMTGAPVSSSATPRTAASISSIAAPTAIRLDRSARAGSAGSPLTALWTLPMVRRLQRPAATAPLPRFHRCHSPISSRRTRSSRR